MWRSGERRDCCISSHEDPPPKSRPEIGLQPRPTKLVPCSWVNLSSLSVPEAQPRQSRVQVLPGEHRSLPWIWQRYTDLKATQMRWLQLQKLAFPKHSYVLSGNVCLDCPAPAPLPSEEADKRDLVLWGCRESLPQTNSMAKRVQHQTPQTDPSLKIKSPIT